MTANVRLDGDELVATRHVRADHDLVWQAFTTPEHLAAFWGGHHATVPPGSVSVDLRVGGGFELETRGDDGTSTRLRFRYDVVEPPVRLVLTEPHSGITTDIRLEATSTGTTVVVHQRRLPRELQTEQAATGLAGILDQLATALHTIRTQPKETSPLTAQTQLVDRYMDGFRRSDHEAILQCLTEDVVWRIHGLRTTNGKAEFDGEIENPAFEGSPELSVERTIETDGVVVTTGTGIGHHRETGRFQFAYNDIFTFRNGLIAQVDSYVVPIT